MQGNKDKSYPLKENESGFYHLRLTFKRHIPSEKRYDEEKRIVKVSVFDFAQYRKPETQKAVGWTELEILHDPTIKEKPQPKEPDKEIPAEEQQGQSEPIKSKPKHKQKPKSK